MTLTDALIPGISLVAGGVGAFLGAYAKFIVLDQRVKHLETDIAEIKAHCKTMNDKVVACEVRQEERGEKPLVKRKSPISLTERGLDLLKNSGGQAWISTNRDSLLAALKAKNPQSPYDVQEFSKQVLKEKEADPLMSPLKDYAYQQGLDLNDILLVMGIHLRDEAMPLFPGFKLTDIPDAQVTTSQENVKA
jgi:hypothetical protein